MERETNSLSEKARPGSTILKCISDDANLQLVPSGHFRLRLIEQMPDVILAIGRRRRQIS